MVVLQLVLRPICELKLWVGATSSHQAQAPAYAAKPLRSAQARTISLFPDAKAGARVDDENGLKNAARPLQELESATRASEGTSFPNHNSEVGTVMRAQCLVQTSQQLWNCWSAVV